MSTHFKPEANEVSSLNITIQLEPEMVSEKVAAKIIDESWESRRRRRYEDEARIARGEEPIGPIWVKDGTRVKYRVRDLRSYVADLPDIRRKFQAEYLTAKKTDFPSIIEQTPPSRGDRS